MDEISKLMKFRDPKTGEVFEDIGEAHSRFCGSADSGKRCDECPLDVIRRGYGCISFRDAHPIEAAQLMGLEVLDDIPVLCGWWEKLKPGSDVIYCSVCESEAYWDTDYGQQKFPYCPYCGARMGGEGHEAG